MKDRACTMLAGVVVVIGCQAAAQLWPSPPGPADATFLPETMLLLAAMSFVFGLTIGYIAWDAGEWAPTLLALGCLSMASGAVMRFVFSPDGLGLEPSAGAGFAPLLGMLLGGGWFFAAVQTWWPATGLRNRRRVVATRALLVTGASAAVLSCYLFAEFPALLPSAGLTTVLAGLAAPGYIMAGVRFLAVWRFLRLPSQFMTAIGSFVFGGVVVMLAAGGIPGVAPYQLEIAVIASAALPVTGFIIEHVRRPGLRAMVFGLFFPGAVASMRRGYPRAMTLLLERIAAYDSSLRGHVDRVADLSARLALDLRLSPQDVREVMVASQLHDIGKLLVPRDLLLKPGKLTDEQRAIIQRHSVSGAQIVARIPEVALAVRGVREHHEHWDGTGYPGHKLADEIALSARIIAVADVYDALRSQRSYKREWSVAEAVAEIERGAGTHFEPRVVQALVRLIASGAESPLSAPDETLSQPAA